jgi:hypothetical protein
MAATGKTKFGRYKKTVLALLDAAHIEFKTIAFARETVRANASSVVVDSDASTVKFYYDPTTKKYTPEQCAYHEVCHVLTEPLMLDNAQDERTWELVTRHLERVLLFVARTK